MAVGFVLGDPTCTVGVVASGRLREDRRWSSAAVSHCEHAKRRLNAKQTPPLASTTWVNSQIVCKDCGSSDVLKVVHHADVAILDQVSAR